MTLHFNKSVLITKFYVYFQMGYDIKIVSMNLSKAGRQNESYLRRLLDGEKPDLCLLPGDNTDMKNCVICGYEQYLTQGNEQTVLLYNPNRLKLKWSPVSVNQYNQLPGTNFDDLVCPEAEVQLGPYKEPKRFSILTWHFSLTRETSITRRTQAENIIRLSQNISRNREIPMFIGGDFNIDLVSMQQLVKHVSSEGKQALNQQATESELFPEETWLPSMKNGTLRLQRHLIAMEVFACKQSSSIVAEYGSQQQFDFFVASKALLLKETTLVDLGCATGKTTRVNKCVTEEPKLKPTANGNYMPTKTIMSPEARPPKHFGG